MGLRVVNFRGEHQRWGGAAVRSLFCTTFPIGLLWVIVSGANRSVQDVVLRTSVIYDWPSGMPTLGGLLGRSRRGGDASSWTAPEPGILTYGGAMTSDLARQAAPSSRPSAGLAALRRS